MEGEDVRRLLDGVLNDLKSLLIAANVSEQQPLTDEWQALKRNPEPVSAKVLCEKLSLDFGHEDIAPVSSGELLEVLRKTLYYSVNTSSPLFLNRLYSGAELAGILGEWIVAALNTSAGAWDVAPVFVLMERETIKRFLWHVGYANGCGVFCPGGSASNLYAIHVARERALSRGHKLASLAAFCSLEAHYSLDKSARLIGLSEEQVWKVPVDSFGRILPDALVKAMHQAKSSGYEPFFVHLTSGTTVLGAFDEIDKVCESVSEQDFPNAWIHVDASWGGAVLLSDKRKHLMRGVEKSDSVAWCAHKVIGAPLHASVILYKDKDSLRAGFDCTTPYIYQNDGQFSEEAQLDWFGKYTLQCSRPNDSVKVWLVFRHLGSVGLERKVEHAYDMSAHLVSLIQSDQFPNFRLVHTTPQFTNVCFWFLPDNMIQDYETDFQVKSGSFFGPRDPNHRVGKIVSLVRAEMVRQGKLLMGYSNLASHGFPYFFRFVALSRNLRPEHLEFALHHLAAIGNAMNK